CENKCYSDVSQAKWAALVTETKEVSEINKWLQKKGVTHILFCWDDVHYIMPEHDPRNVHSKAFTFLTDEYLPICTEEIYTDEWVKLFQIISDNEFCQ
ncbi:MAG: hypothetical protein SCH68_12855, partial [Brevefilum sp.]|nr:hypothetical protein [Brevefilum sp.]